MQRSPGDMGAGAAAVNIKPFGWLMGMPFDLTLIVGVALLALGSGSLSVIVPQLFLPLLILDLWFLGYHHVVATFTRLCFDAESFHEYKFLVLGLPIIVAVSVVVAFLAIGPWVVASTYLYWQWFHYTRQSYGLARIYQIKAGIQPSPFDQWVIYSLPLAGILYRSFQSPGYFLWLELKVFPVSYWMFAVVFAVSIGVTVLWLYSQINAYREGRFAGAYFLYMVSHFLIFYVGYILIQGINEGWLVLNIWHNAQYILFVWMFNNKRFKNQIDPKHHFLSMLSLKKNQWLYYGLCLVISTVAYKGIGEVFGVFNFDSIPMISVVIFQTINFHHYIADGIIWKVRKKSLRDKLGV